MDDNGQVSKVVADLCGDLGASQELLAACCSVIATQGRDAVALAQLSETSHMRELVGVVPQLAKGAGLRDDTGAVVTEHRKACALLAAVFGSCHVLRHVRQEALRLLATVLPPTGGTSEALAYACGYSAADVASFLQEETLGHYSRNPSSPGLRGLDEIAEANENAFLFDALTSEDAGATPGIIQRLVRWCDGSYRLARATSLLPLSVLRIYAPPAGLSPGALALLQGAAADCAGVTMASYRRASQLVAIPPVEAGYRFDVASRAAEDLDDRRWVLEIERRALYGHAARSAVQQARSEVQPSR